MADFKITINPIVGLIEPITELAIAGENLVSGNLVYLGIDGKYYKTTSTDVTKCRTELRLPMNTILANEQGRFMIYGEQETTTSLGDGVKILVGETLGTVTDTPSTNPLHYQRYIGTSTGSNKFLFNPDATYVRVDGTEIDGIPVTIADLNIVEDTTPELGGDLDALNQDINNIKELGFQNGEKISWNSDELTLNIPTGLGPVLQVGQETWVHVFNDTAGTLFNGKVVYPTGTSTGGLPNVDYAIANSHETIEAQVGLLTGDILPGQDGFATLVGTVRDIDTSLLAPGPVYVSATTLGELTSVKPEHPNYSVLMGNVLTIGLEGSIIIDIRNNINDTFANFWNGTFRESHDFTVDSLDGINVIGSLTAKNGSKLSMIFSDGITTLDTSTPLEITLIPGVDANPQPNYIYIPKSTKILTNSSSGFPIDEHIKISYVVLQTAVRTQLESGALVNRNHNDPIENVDSFQGHLSHITERLRLEPAKWDSGVEASIILDTISNPDNIWLSTTSGVIYQLHRQIFPAQDTQSGDNFHVANDFFNAYRLANNFNELTEDGSGVTLNSTSFSVVVWGIINKTGEAQHLMVNLPSSAYPFASPDDAVNDALNYSDYSIPKIFTGVGFLIARFTFTQKNGVWQLIATQDLRGVAPNSISGGGGSGGTGVDSFTALTDTPNGYLGSGGKQVLVNLAETGLEFIEPIEGDKHFVFDQGVPSAIWTITHTLSKKPAVITVDTSDTNVVGNVEYIDNSNLTVTFNTSFAGKAYLN